MKYAIIENEEYLRENLRLTISSICPDSECVFTAETVEDSVRFFSKSNDVQLIFMDIELDDGTCFDIFETVEIDIPVIFTTSYSEYAIKAFKVNSIDYLLKPIDDDDLQRAIEKFQKRSRQERVDPQIYRNINLEGATRGPRKRLLVSNSNGYSYISTTDIAWIEAEDKYVSIVTINGNITLTDIKSLGDVAMVLDPDNFFQVSRGVIASIGSIRKVSKYFKGRLKIDLHAGELQREELVSAARREQFLEWLGYV
ncbi:MAG: response regulator transcription factor [Bacteroides sp.]|nr:response regulator transcription factor [Bacteroides sp.]